MSIKRVTEYVFFFGLIAIVGYMVWQILWPFMVALALATVTVVLCYPMYEFILRFSPRRNASLAALISTLIVIITIVIPLYFISSLLVNEFVSFYRSLDNEQLLIDNLFITIEDRVRVYLPEFELNVTEQIRQSGDWLTRNIGLIFTGTISFIFIFIISMLGAFYLFRDGRRFVNWVIDVSPLPDDEDRLILDRLAKAVRAIVVGTVLLSIIQGLVAAVGFSIFGIERAILWGSLGALGSLLPGIGTAGIMIPAVLYLFFTSTLANAIGLLIWGIVAVILVDNFIGPQLMSRNNNLHPFIILLSVLGGVTLFGPIGFIVGPVIVSLFVVLLEIYIHNIIMSKSKESPTEEGDQDSIESKPA